MTKPRSFGTVRLLGSWHDGRLGVHVGSSGEMTGTGSMAV
jgi:hypothetical protein